jgi:hypothetical protein
MNGCNTCFCRTSETEQIALSFEMPKSKMPLSRFQLCQAMGICVNFLVIDSIQRDLPARTRKWWAVGRFSFTYQQCRFSETVIERSLIDIHPKQSYCFKKPLSTKFSSSFSK